MSINDLIVSKPEGEYKKSGRTARRARRLEALSDES
jgi:hypothetical protein